MLSRGGKSTSEPQPELQTMRVQDMQVGDVLWPSGEKITKVEIRSAMAIRYRKVTLATGGSRTWHATTTMHIVKRAEATN